MILSCPNCATRYTLSDAQLGVRGRKVRCTACKTTWHAERPEVPIDLTFSDPRKPEKRVEDLQKVKAPLLPAKYRAILQDKKRLRAIAAQGMVWSGMAATLAVALALAFTLRVDIVRAFPRIAGAYAMVGLKTSGTYLQFGDYSATTAFKGGRFVVSITTQVTNTSDKPEAVPPVRVHLRDASLAEFASVLMPSNGLVVAPHATRTLAFDVSDPKNMTAKLDLDFDLEAMKKMKSASTKTSHADSHEGATEEPAHGEAGHDESGHAETGHAETGHGEAPDGHAGNEATEAHTTGAVSDHPMPALRPALSTVTPDEEPNSHHTADAGSEHHAGH